VALVLVYSGGLHDMGATQEYQQHTVAASSNCVRWLAVYGFSVM
jgi:hypothetical protein